MDAIKKKLNSLKTTANKSTLTWKPEPGKTTVRMVPYQYTPDMPFIELYFHYEVTKKSVLSLDQFGEKDPIVDIANALKSNGSKEDWVAGAKMLPKLRTFVPIVVRGKENEGIKFWGFGKEIYEELLSIMNDPDWGDITDFDNGRDIDITYVTGKEAGNSYGKTTFRVKPASSKLTNDPAILKKITEEQPDIRDLFKKPTYEELEKYLEAWSEGKSTSDVEDDVQQEEQETPAPPKVDAGPKKNKPEDMKTAFDNVFNKKK